MKKRILILFLILTTTFFCSLGVIACEKIPSGDASSTETGNSQSDGNSSESGSSDTSDSSSKDDDSESSGESSDSGSESKPGDETSETPEPTPEPEPEPDPTPTYKSGEDAVMTGAKVTPDKVNPEYAIYYTLGQLANATSYESTGKGSSVTKKIITYTQTTGGRVVKKDGLYYSQSTSNSTFVNVKHEAVVKGDKLTYRNDGGSISTATRQEYMNTYGVTPDKLLTGHIYNPETVKNAKLAKTENGLYYFTFELDKNKATAILKYQMKQFGGLSNYPNFKENAAVTLVINEKFHPVSVKYSSKYTVNIAVLGDCDCTETNEITFSSFNGSTTIPDESKFLSALN